MGAVVAVNAEVEAESHPSTSQSDVSLAPTAATKLLATPRAAMGSITASLSARSRHRADLYEMGFVRHSFHCYLKIFSFFLASMQYFAEKSNPPVPLAGPSRDIPMK